MRAAPPHIRPLSAESDHSCNRKVGAMGRTMQGKYLRHAATNQWLTSDGRLVNDASEAVKIDSILQAMELCRKYNLRGMELVLRFADSEVALPMEDA